jgi:hypothetical protein
VPKPRGIVLDTVLVCAGVVSVTTLTVGIVAAPAELMAARLATLVLVVVMVSLLAFLVRRRLRPRRTTVVRRADAASEPRWPLWYPIGMFGASLLTAYLQFSTADEQLWSLAGPLSCLLIGVGFSLPARMPGAMRP